MKRLGVVVLVLALAGCGSSGGPADPSPSTSPTIAAPTTFSVQGDITVADGLAAGPGGPCVTTGTGYDDIEAGTAVVVKDNSGKQVALGRLVDGVATDDSDDTTVRCVFGFSVRDVPEGSPIYTISIGRRGETAYSRADLNSPINLTLG